ncbi:MAG: hypothetical protein WB402_14115 [Sulfuricaulis sp.]|uniref:hypothetical protein n=1 Tax=Sulfuricaulis sp. TaxID=2003553 RepID=UPI003C393112
MDTSTIAVTVESFSGKILDYALLLAAIGTIAMALLELIKSVTYWRRHFHRGRLERWLATAPDSKSAHQQLMLLAAGGPGNANVLYDQTTAKLMGQVQAAANVALDFPSKYPAFYEFIAAMPQVRELREGADDAKIWLKFSAERMEGRPRKVSITDDMQARGAAQARARLGNLVSRKLDALQNEIEFVWARLNQLWSVAGGGALLAWILLNQKPHLSPDMIVLLSVLGGLVAPFAKDVVNALTSLRARR